MDWEWTSFMNGLQNFIEDNCGDVQLLRKRIFEVNPHFNELIIIVRIREINKFIALVIWLNRNPTINSSVFIIISSSLLFSKAAFYDPLML